MNPATGTFITMDEYAGSVFEPVSLHKYLYANANPVMFSDPSGYSAEGTLTNQITAIGVIGILSAIILPNYSSIINALGFLLTEVYDAFTITVDSIIEWNEGIASGAIASSDIAGDVREKTEKGDEKEKTPPKDTNKNLEGEPNSTVPRYNSEGQIIGERTFGPDGKADYDTDFTNHGNPKQHPKVPHRHKWDWSDPANPIRIPWDL